MAPPPGGRGRASSTQGLHTPRSCPFRAKPPKIGFVNTSVLRRAVIDQASAQLASLSEALGTPAPVQPVQQAPITEQASVSDAGGAGSGLAIKSRDAGAGAAKDTHKTTFTGLPVSMRDKLLGSSTGASGSAVSGGAVDYSTYAQSQLQNNLGSSATRAGAGSARAHGLNRPSPRLGPPMRFSKDAHSRDRSAGSSKERSERPGTATSQRSNMSMSTTRGDLADTSGRRRKAIDELYRELRRLEDEDMHGHA